MKDKVIKFGAFIVLLSLFVGCTYSINHKPIPNTLPLAQNDQSVLLVIPPESRNFTEHYSNLSGDKWIFEVGKALVDIAPQIFRNQYGNVSVTDAIPVSFIPSPKNQLVILTIESFKTDIGWTVFSRHNGTIVLSVEERGKNSAKHTVSGSGSDSGGSYGKTYAALFLPSVGITGYNEAMAAMITNAVTAASIAALQANQ